MRSVCVEIIRIISALVRETTFKFDCACSESTLCIRIYIHISIDKNIIFIILHCKIAVTPILICPAQIQIAVYVQLALVYVKRGAVIIATYPYITVDI